MSSPTGSRLTPAPIRAGQRVLVVGLGRFGGGVGVTRWLVSQGATVTVTDRADASSLTESLEAIADLPGIRLQLGGHDPRELAEAELVVINPAVAKSRSELFREIEARGIPWTTEINLFCERCPAPIVGVTGTYGKSTTCAMIAHVLQAVIATHETNFTHVHLGGNIGKSLLPVLDAMLPSDIVVLELSNAQLEDVPRIHWSPRVAVITNLHPHHLDRYTDFGDYVNAKMNIIGDSAQTKWIIAGALALPAEVALGRRVPSGDPRLVRLEPIPELYGTGKLCGTGIFPVSSRAGSPLHTRYENEVLGSDVESLPLRVPGRHNQINALTAFTVCTKLGVSAPATVAALATFEGLPHRLQLVRTLRGVSYINDSKATAPPATIQAVESVSPPLIVLVGGQAKPDVALDDFGSALARGCRIVIGFGEAGPAFITAVRAASEAPMRANLHNAATLNEAFRIAVELARPGDTILLSPGAASYDAYANYTERGRHFTQLVQSLT